MRELNEYVHARLQDELKKINRLSTDILPELTVEEKAIIYKYTDDGYESLNEMLRNSKGAKISKFGEYLSYVLSKLPNYNDVVFRGTKLYPSRLEKYKIAYENQTIIADFAFLSASQKKSIARQFGTLIFEILSKNGKNIENISKFGLNSGQNEREILFPSGSKFLVRGIEKQDIYTLITLKEL